MFNVDMNRKDVVEKDCKHQEYQLTAQGFFEVNLGLKAQVEDLDLTYKGEQLC